MDSRLVNPLTGMLAVPSNYAYGTRRGHNRTSSASRGGSRLVSGGLAAVDVRDFAGDLGIHPDSPAGVLDGQ